MELRNIVAQFQHAEALRAAKPLSADELLNKGVTLGVVIVLGMVLLSVNITVSGLIYGLVRENEATLSQIETRQGELLARIDELKKRVPSGSLPTDAQFSQLIGELRNLRSRDASQDGLDDGR